MEELLLCLHSRDGKLDAPVCVCGPLPSGRWRRVDVSALRPMVPLGGLVGYFLCFLTPSEEQVPYLGWLPGTVCCKEATG